MREEVMMWTERPPKAEMATMMGMTNEKAPRILSPKVCGERRSIKIIQQAALV